MLAVIITAIKYKQVTKVFFYDKTTFTSIVAAANSIGSFESSLSYDYSNSNEKRKKKSKQLNTYR